MFATKVPSQAAASGTAPQPPDETEKRDDMVEKLENLTAATRSDYQAVISAVGIAKQEVLSAVTQQVSVLFDGLTRRLEATQTALENTIASKLAADVEYWKRQCELAKKSEGHAWEMEQARDRQRSYGFAKHYESERDVKLWREKADEWQGKVAEWQRWHTEFKPYIEWIETRLQTVTTDTERMGANYTRLSDESTQLRATNSRLVAEIQEYQRQATESIKRLRPGGQKVSVQVDVDSISG